MRMRSLFDGLSRNRGGVQDLARRWKTAQFGAPRPGAQAPVATVVMALRDPSLLRLAGDLRGVSIECREGRLWLAQAGATPGVILQPGQRFVPRAAGAIMLQQTPSKGKRRCAVSNEDALALDGRICPGTAEQPGLPPEPGAVGESRLPLPVGGRGELFEALAFMLLWLSGLLMVVYALTTVIA